jgi:hypothetical protein
VIEKEKLEGMGSWASSVINIFGEINTLERIGSFSRIKDRSLILKIFKELLI